MKNIYKATIVPGVVVLSGCGSLYNKGAKDDLSKRASFELNCPAEKLEYTVLQKRADGYVTSYGVSGCEKRAVYVISGFQWLLNSDPDSE